MLVLLPDATLGCPLLAAADTTNSKVEQLREQRCPPQLAAWVAKQLAFPYNHKFQAQARAPRCRCRLPLLPLLPLSASLELWCRV